MSRDIASRSPRKHELLRTLSMHGPMETPALKDRMDTSGSSVENILSRCRRDGLVESDGGAFRPGGGNTPAEHDITPRGEERLDYYEGDEEG